MSKDISKQTQSIPDEKIVKVKYEITAYIIMGIDTVVLDGAKIAEDLIIRPNFASKIQSVRLAHTDPFVECTTTQVIS